MVGIENIFYNVFLFSQMVYYLSIKLLGTFIKMYLTTVYTLQLPAIRGEISKTGADG